MHVYDLVPGAIYITVQGDIVVYLGWCYELGLPTFYFYTCGKVCDLMKLSGCYENFEGYLRRSLGCFQARAIHFYSIPFELQSYEEGVLVGLSLEYPYYHIKERVKGYVTQLFMMGLFQADLYCRMQYCRFTNKVKSIPYNSLVPGRLYVVCKESCYDYKVYLGCNNGDYVWMDVAVVRMYVSNIDWYSGSCSVSHDTGEYRVVRMVEEVPINIAAVRRFQ